MSRNYDSWERLVRAVLRREQFRLLSRSPSIQSMESCFSSSSRVDDQDSWWQEEPPDLVILSDFSPAFDFKHVSTASAELLGKGTFGSAYAATMNNGVRFVMKRLKMCSMSELDFKYHMDALGNVNHGNIAPVRAYYASGDERILLYDYHSNGSVYALLHGQTGENRAQVGWETRLTIAIGAARAIAEIHKNNGGKLVHGNIKASNVFLSPRVYCCVSDVGLSSMIETTFMPSARCYAPQVKNSKDVSQASDVYSFGILLLELVTRKSSVHVPGVPKVANLAKLVTSKRASKVLDADLSRYPAIMDKMVGMLRIGVKCVAKSTKKRPKMSEVVKMLEDIGQSQINPISRAPLEQILVFFEDVIHGFDLEDVLTSSAEVLGKGTFGTSHKMVLENGNTIVVKKLKDVVVTFKGFQEHMSVFGRMKHKNIANIMAYYFSRDEKLVVCHYYHDTSVSALLRGMRATGRTVLGWKTRLKIVADVAMGIAHIHGENDCKLVHGNIKSSNIFIHEQNHAVVSDAGYSKLTNPIKLSDRKHSGHHAPEVTDTWKVSQASDVYSFGVFLIQLASGLPLQWKRGNGEVVSLVEWFQSLSPDKWIGEVFGKELLKNQNRKEEVEMLQYLRIAMDCINIDPCHRPKAPQVVRMLESCGIELANKLRCEDAQEDVLEDTLQASIESRLENLLLDLLPTLEL